MADPLSITTGVLSLLTITLRVGWQLKTFYDGAAFADTKIRSLITDVDSFARVLQLMKDTFEQDAIKSSLQETGHVGSHWRNLAASVHDGQETIAQLDTMLTDINKTVGFLDGARKHVRLLGAAEEIVMYQQQIQAYRDTLQLSLQTIILWNQVAVRESSELIIPALDVIYKEIRRLAKTFNVQMSEMRASMQANSSSSASEVMKESSLIILQNTVQSASVVVSSASTIIEGPQPNGAQHYGSDFGDCFPSKPSETVTRWMSSNTVYELVEDQETLQGTASQPGLSEDIATENGTDSDSDEEFELELFQALMKRGEDKLGKNDGKGAESVFRNCLTRIPGSNAESRRTLKLQVMEGLAESCRFQGKLDDARSIYLERMKLHPHDTQIGKAGTLKDTVALVDVLITQKSYPEAMLYARKALKGFRRLDGPAGKAGVISSLDCLIRICHEEGNFDEEHAFTTILENARNKNNHGSPATPLSDHSESNSELSLVEKRQHFSRNNDGRASPLPRGKSRLPLPTGPPPVPESRQRNKDLHKIAEGLPKIARNIDERLIPPVSKFIVSQKSVDSLVEVTTDLGLASPKATRINRQKQDPSVPEIGINKDSDSGVRQSARKFRGALKREEEQSMRDEVPFDPKWVENRPEADNFINFSSAWSKRYVLFVGSQSCGKTDFLRRAVSLKSHSSETKSSSPNQIGREYQIRSAQGDGLDMEFLHMIIQENTSYQIFTGVWMHDFEKESFAVVCFDIGNPETLRQARRYLITYFPPMKLHQNVKYNIDAPLILLGLKKDLRTDPTTIAMLESRGKHPVTVEEAHAARRHILAKMYLECSVKTGEGVEEAIFKICQFAYNNTSLLKQSMTDRLSSTFGLRTNYRKKGRLLEWE